MSQKQTPKYNQLFSCCYIKWHKGTSCLTLDDILCENQTLTFWKLNQIQEVLTRRELLTLKAVRLKQGDKVWKGCGQALLTRDHRSLKMCTFLWLIYKLVLSSMITGAYGVDVPQHHRRHQMTLNKLMKIMFGSGRLECIFLLLKKTIRNEHIIYV